VKKKEKRNAMEGKYRFIPFTTPLALVVSCKEQNVGSESGFSFTTSLGGITSMNRTWGGGRAVPYYTTAAAYGQRIDQSLKILPISHSSRFYLYKRQEITSAYSSTVLGDGNSGPARTLELPLQVLESWYCAQAYRYCTVFFFLSVSAMG